LIESLLQLRLAERTFPGSAEIAAVRADLEEMIGPTVTRASTARLLGVSQTALERWIASGDVPILITPSGRRETPLRALIELIEAVRERRTTYPTDRHPLAAVLHTRRAEAERLNTSKLINAIDRNTNHRNAVSQRNGASEDGHYAAAQRALAYHRAVAQCLDAQTVRDARSRLQRWRSQERIDPFYARAWEEILAMTPAQIAQAIGADTSRMRDLRQSSPFAGALSEPARRRVLATVHQTSA
jgi:hypothetical protein